MSKKLKNEIKKLEELIKNATVFDALPREEKESFDELEMELNNIVTKNDLIVNLIQNLVQWNTYLVYMEAAQEFELCQRILDTIEIEIADVYRCIDTYFLLSDIDLELLDSVRIDARKIASNSDDLLFFLNTLK